MTGQEYETFDRGIGITTLAARGTVEEIRESDPIEVSGVAIPENTVLQGGQGVEHFFPPDVARRAAEILQRQVDDDDTTVHIVKNFHETEGQASADDIIGEVTGAGYEKGVGVVFSGEIADEDTAEKIELGYLDVSPSVARELGPLDEQTQARAVDEVVGFRDIAVVGQGQRGADVDIGANPAIEALSRNALSEVDTLQLSNARRPDYSGTETGEWSTPDLSEYLSAYDTLPDDADSVDDLSEDERQFIASKTLLGDANGETLREVRFFPVVEPSTDNLSRRALIAVRSGRGQQADIPESSWQSAASMAGRLLNEEFDADVKVDITEAQTGELETLEDGGEDEDAEGDDIADGHVRLVAEDDEDERRVTLTE